MPAICTAPGRSPKISMAMAVGTSTPSFMKVAESTTPLRAMFHWSSRKPPRYIAPLTSPSPTVKATPSRGKGTAPAKEAARTVHIR